MKEMESMKVLMMASEALRAMGAEATADMLRKAIGEGAVMALTMAGKARAEELGVPDAADMLTAGFVLGLTYVVVRDTAEAVASGEEPHVSSMGFASATRVMMPHGLECAAAPGWLEITAVGDAERCFMPGPKAEPVTVHPGFRAVHVPGLPGAFRIEPVDAPPATLMH